MIRRHKNLQKDFFFLTFSMFVIVCLWIGFNIYHTYATSTIDETLQLTILPINGNFDKATINTLKTKTVIQPEYTNPLATAAAITEAPIPTIVLPTATPELLPTDIPLDPTIDPGGIAQ